MEDQLTGPLFFVDDLAVTRKFYEGLGFTTAIIEHDYLEMFLGGEREVHLEFAPINPELPIYEFYDAGRTDKRGHGVFQFIRVKDVDERFAALTAAGCKTLGEPKSWPWKQREFIVVDPDGYKLIYWQKVS